MSTFDGWEDHLYGDVMALPPGNELMHFRTKGSKNGVRRYQMPDGTWTPLGLKERKAREGWGERHAAKKAERKSARLERRAARLEKKAAKNSARKERMAALKEKKRQNDVSKLTDAELKQRIERAKMEQEYRELTKSPLLKTGEKLAAKYLENRAIKSERDYERKREAVQYAREMLKLKEQTKQKQIDAEANKEKAKADSARAAADKARAETDKLDIEKGTRKMSLKNEKRNLKMQGKRFVADYTVRGGIRKKMNAISTARGAGRAEKIKEKAFVKGIIKGRKKIDKYNKTRRYPWDRIPYDPNAWDRDKNSHSSNKNNNNKKKNK